jgi:quinoprotein glucose dehydrogenase
VPAVVIGTKTGMIFVLHRETGEPLFPVEERPVPPSDVPGENAWPTQPFALLPAPLHGTRLTPDSAFGLTDETRAFCRAWIARLRNEGIFTPPSLRGTLLWPGFGGGINWDGMAWDPERRVIVTTVKRLAMFVQLHSREDYTASLANRGEGLEYANQGGTPYGMTRMPMVAPDGVPCSPPPWGSIVAIGLDDGEVRWQRPLGVPRAAEGRPDAEQLGSITFGGPLITAGGLVFIGAGPDDRFRAFDIDTGDLLWEYQLPAGGQASPMTYRYDGRQYIVIAAGGRGGIGSPGDWIVAFALPDRN